MLLKLFNVSAPLCHCARSGRNCLQPIRRWGPPQIGTVYTHGPESVIGSSVVKEICGLEG